MSDETARSIQTHRTEPAEGALPLWGLPFLAPVIWLALFPLFPEHLLYFSKVIEFPEGAGWMLAAWCLAALICFRGWLAPWSVPVLAGGAFFLWLAMRAGMAGSEFGRLGLLGLLFFLIAAALPSFVVRQYIRAHLVVLWFVLGIAGGEWLGVLDAELMRTWRYEVFFSGETPRLSGTFFHPNLFAYYLYISLIIVSWADVAHRGIRRGRWALLLQGGLCAFFLFHTYSRGVILAAGLTVLFMAMLPAGRTVFPRRRVLLFALAPMLGALVSVWSAREAWISRTLQATRMVDQAMATVAEPSVAAVSARLGPGELDRIGRAEIWTEAMHFVRQAPLGGIGAGEFHRRGRGFYHAHNAGLELLLSGGAVVLAFLMVFTVGILRRRTRLGPAHLLMAAPFIAGIFDSFLFFKFPFILMALVMGILARPRPGEVALPGMMRTPGNLSLPAVSRRWSSYAVYTGVVFFLVMGFRLAIMMLEQYPIDSFSYYAAVRHTLLTGEHPYVAWPSGLLLPPTLPMAEWSQETFGQVPLRFFYPPTAITLLAPLAWIGNAGVAAVAYYGLQWIALVFLAAGAVILSGRRELAWVAVVILASHAELMIDLLVGNISLIMGACAMWCWLLHRRGYSAEAGALLSIAVSLKIFPVMWLAFVLVERRGAVKFLIGFVGGLALMLAITINILDLDLWPAYKFWVLDTLPVYPPDGPNSSVLGLLGPYENPLAAELRLAVLIVLGSIFLHGLISAGQASGSRDLLATAVLALSVLAVPIAWSHYHLIPLGLLISCFLRTLDDPREPVTYALLFCLVGMSLGYTQQASWVSTTWGSVSMMVLVLLPSVAPLMRSKLGGFSHPYGNRSRGNSPAKQQNDPHSALAGTH